VNRQYQAVSTGFASPETIRSDVQWWSAHRPAATHFSVAACPSRPRDASGTSYPCCPGYDERPAIDRLATAWGEPAFRRRCARRHTPPWNSYRSRAGLHSRRGQTTAVRQELTDTAALAHRARCTARSVDDVALSGVRCRSIPHRIADSRSVRRKRGIHRLVRDDRGYRLLRSARNVLEDDLVALIGNALSSLRASD